MSARGHSIATVEADGTRHVRWAPGPAPAEAYDRKDKARQFAAGAKSREVLGAELGAALKRLGTLYRFDVSHWQVRRDRAVVLDFWITKKGKASWRWKDGATHKGMPADLLQSVVSR